MSWLAKLLPSKIRTSGDKKKDVPAGLWSKCDACQAVLFQAELERNLNVCPKCQHHIYLPARRRLKVLLDEGLDFATDEIAPNLETIDRLKFRDSKKYKDRISAAQKKTGENEAIIAVKGTLKGIPVVMMAMDFKYMGGSMGSVVGERFARATDLAIAENRALICFAASGGARMQEGLISLMQMAKTSAALARLSEHGLPFISVLTHPTTGGVTASFAMLGDINIAEPNALIGFAGPRVIEQTVRETLPEGFQRSEFLLEHGSLDMIVDRREMRDTLARLIAKLTKQQLNAA